MESGEKAKILLVEDDRNFGELLRDEIEDMGLNVLLVDTAGKALEKVRRWMPDLIVSDLRLPKTDGLELLERVKFETHEGLAPDFFIVTAFGSVSKAVECLQAGAEDFLTKPIDFDHLRHKINRVLEKRGLRKEIRQIESLLSRDADFYGMFGRSQSMIAMFQHLRQVAKADGPVLIMGESGTGKELVARAIHAEGKSDDAPFLAVNCAGIPEHLLESEFFGHEAGAFTGAGKSRRGLFAEAEGGTLLLDEITEMPLPMQAKLLRMLQDGKIRPVGGNCERQVNVRVLASTNRNIEKLVEDNQFREDLFYRLDTFPLRVPPLRERDDDIDLLSGIFLGKFACAAGKKVKGFSGRALDILRKYHFPGNVRELRNAIERAVVFCQGSEIRPEHLPPRILGTVKALRPKSDQDFVTALGLDDDELPTLEEVEQRYVRHVMNKVDGNKRLAASILGVARCTLYRRLEDLSFNRDHG